MFLYGNHRNLAPTRIFLTEIHKNELLTTALSRRKLRRRTTILEAESIEPTTHLRTHMNVEFTGIHSKSIYFRWINESLHIFYKNPVNSSQNSLHSGTPAPNMPTDVEFTGIPRISAKLTKSYLFSTKIQWLPTIIRCIPAVLQSTGVTRVRAWSPRGTLPRW